MTPVSLLAQRSPPDPHKEISTSDMMHLDLWWKIAATWSIILGMQETTIRCQTEEMDALNATTVKVLSEAEVATAVEEASHAALPIDPCYKPTESPHQNSWKV